MDRLSIPKKRSKKDQSVLSSKTVEIMLHKWPEWRQSVKAARELPEMAYPLPELYTSRQEWLNKYGGWAWQHALSEMHRLDLPEHFWRYWLCCVQSDYEMDDNTLDYNKILDFHGEERLKVYPPELFRIVVWADVKEPGKFGPINIEMHPRFASKSVLNKATTEMVKVAKFFSKEQHPVSAHKEQAKAQSRISQRRTDMRKRFISGESSFEELLKEEALHPKVQGVVEEINRKYRNIYDRRVELKKLKRKVYTRVRARLSGLGLFPRIGSKWWPYIIKK